MGELSIKIRIADKEYPMKIDPEDEERIRLAGKMLNERLIKYKDQFGLEDKQDLLAIVAFDCFVEILQKENNLSSIEENITAKIDYIESIIQ